MSCKCLAQTSVSISQSLVRMGRQSTAHIRDDNNAGLPAKMTEKLFERLVKRTTYVNTECCYYETETSSHKTPDQSLLLCTQDYFHMTNKQELQKYSLLFDLTMISPLKKLGCIQTSILTTSQLQDLHVEVATVTVQH